MYALGVANFFGSSFNRFDTLVITCSVLEILWVHFHERADSFGFSALRALRLLRCVLLHNTLLQLLVSGTLQNPLRKLLGC